MKAIVARAILTSSALLSCMPALAQADMRPLQDSTVTVQPGKAPPVPYFRDTASRQAYLRWLANTSALLEPYIPGKPSRTEFLQTAWYESKRAGLDVSLVLGLVEVLSGYRGFAVTQNGSLGYMAVNPSWSQTIGDGDVSKLFHLQTNLRFGCVILRHYLDASGGDSHMALAKYLGNNLALAESNPKIGATINRIYAAAARLDATR